MAGECIYIYIQNIQRVVSCLREQVAQRYANTLVDRQVGKTIKMLRPNIFIGQTFLVPTASTERINTDEYI